MVSVGTWIAGAVLGVVVWAAVPDGTAPDGPAAAAPAGGAASTNATVYTVKVPGVG